MFKGKSSSQRFYQRGFLEGILFWHLLTYSYCISIHIITSQHTNHFHITHETVGLLEGYAMDTNIYSCKFNTRNNILNSKWYRDTSIPVGSSQWHRTTTKNYNTTVHITTVERYMLVMELGMAYSEEEVCIEIYEVGSVESDKYFK